MSRPDLSHLAHAQRVRVLMVCMGNICRSPTAQGILEQLVLGAGMAERIHIDSAGTHGYHIGKAPDARAQQHALRRGVDLSAQRARQLVARDFDQFDLILVMDEANERGARALATPRQNHKIFRLTEFCASQGIVEVPDPYYGGADGFEKVLDLVEDACEGLMQKLKALLANDKGL